MTLQYYQENAAEFIESTQNIDMSELYGPFLALLPSTGAILDAGCGSGRDTKFFIQRGFQLVAFDGSPEIVRIASEKINHDVLLLTFSDLDFHGQFDGVWACASTLHVLAKDMQSVLGKLADALKTGGVMYTSYKYGEGESIRGGRHFSNYTESTLGELVAQVPKLKLHEIWRTKDLRPGRQEEIWINALLRAL